MKTAVSRAPFADSSAAAVRDETEGLVKVVYEESTGRLLGVHILGAGAEELIHIAAVAMRGPHAPGPGRDALRLPDRRRLRLRRHVGLTGSDFRF